MLPPVKGKILILVREINGRIPYFHCLSFEDSKIELSEGFIITRMH